MGNLSVLHTGPPARPLCRPEGEGHPVAPDLSLTASSPRCPGRVAGHGVIAPGGRLDVQHQLPPLARQQVKTERLSGGFHSWPPEQSHDPPLVLIRTVEEGGHVYGAEVVLYRPRVNTDLGVTTGGEDPDPGDEHRGVRHEADGVPHVPPVLQTPTSLQHQPLTSEASSRDASDVNLETNLFSRHLQLNGHHAPGV